VVSFAKFTKIPFNYPAEEALSGYYFSNYSFGNLQTEFFTVSLFSISPLYSLFALNFQNWLFNSDSV